jgi:hypothetical protein
MVAPSVVAAFERITDRKMQRGIVRLTSSIAEHVQPKGVGRTPAIQGAGR